MDNRFYEQCEQEQLHLSGQIQSHGWLLVVTGELRISHVSENIARLFDVGAANLIGKPLPRELGFLLDNLPQNAGERHFVHYQSERNEAFDLHVIKAQQGWLIECYPVATDADSRLPVLDLPSVFVDRHERDFFCNELLRWIAAVTGHDRVMYYQFLEDGDGHVTAEVCSDNARGSYLDLRFPASDIPQIARNIYLLNPWREIVSSTAAPLNLYGAATVPDLTYADLRSVSPMHLQYMQNMGVISSVSFPVVKNDQLDALISCHSGRERQLPLPVLEAVASTVSAFTLRDKELEARKRLNFIDEFNFQITSISALLNAGQPIEQIWEALSADIADYFDVDGLVLCLGDMQLTYGLTFDSASLEQIDRWFIDYSDGFVFQTDNLQSLMAEPPLTEVAGFCCLKFRTGKPGAVHVRLYLTRQEYIHEVSWGGNPNKPTESPDDALPVSPRRSFSRWVEKRLGYSKAWPPTTALQLHRFRALLEQSRLMSDVQPES